MQERKEHCIIHIGCIQIKVRSRRSVRRTSGSDADVSGREFVVPLFHLETRGSKRRRLRLPSNTKCLADWDGFSRSKTVLI